MFLPFNVSKWAPWLERVQPAGTKDPFPIDKALEWIRLESGGNICGEGRVGTVNGVRHSYEVGLAQTYFETPSTVKYGVTSAQLRAKCSGSAMPTNLTDDDRILQARVALETFKEHRAYARRRLLNNGAQLAEKSADFWCWVKLGHALPALFDYLPDAKRSLGHFPSWRQFTNYVDSIPDEQLKSNSRRYAHEDSTLSKPYVGWSRFWRNCESFAGYTAGGFISFDVLALLACTVAAFVLAHYVV